MPRPNARCCRGWSRSRSISSGRLELRGVPVRRAEEQQEGGVGRDADAAERRVLGHGTHLVAERRFQPEHLLHEPRDLLGATPQLILKLGALGQQAHRVAEQAGGGLAPGAQQDVQDGGGLEVAEHPVVHGAWRRRRGCRPPGPASPPRPDRRSRPGSPRTRVTSCISSSKVSVDPTIAVESNAAVSSWSRPASRKPIRRLVIVIGTTLADGGHELRRPAVQRPRHALVGEVGDIGLECRHALGDQLGEDGFAVQRVRGRIRGGERLRGCVTEGQAAGLASAVAVEQALDVRREVLGPAGRLGHQLGRGDREDPVPGISHTGARAGADGRTDRDRRSPPGQAAVFPRAPWSFGTFLLAGDLPE